jgi:hypothetical protein
MEYIPIIPPYLANKYSMNSTTSGQDHQVVVIWTVGTKSPANCKMYSGQFAMNLLDSTALAVF